MITLRQHAISLAAVFLALAVGVILGSGLLNDTLLSGLREDKRSQQRQIEDLNQDKNAWGNRATDPGGAGGSDHNAVGHQRGRQRSRMAARLLEQDDGVGAEPGQLRHS
ncbi:putative channel-forming protein [Mycobacteroides abscessus subsp. abscessus]|nr:putative channel-forming protein [Mycobacteroides abscessus subsp. abscessus]